MKDKAPLDPHRVLVVIENRSITWPDRTLRGLGSRKKGSGKTRALGVYADDPFITGYTHNLRELKDGERVAPDGDVFVQPEADYPPTWRKELAKLRGQNPAKVPTRAQVAAQNVKGKAAVGSVAPLDKD